MLHAKAIHLKNPNGRYFSSAKRLDIMTQGTVLELFAADVYYHKICLERFIYVQKNEPDPAVAFVQEHFRNCITF